MNRFLRSLILFSLIISYLQAGADTGCYVKLAAQGVDDNTIYLQPHSSGSWDYAGAQYHPVNTACIEFTTQICHIYRDPIPPFFPNGPLYDTGVIVNYSPGIPCGIDEFLVLLVIPITFFSLHRINKSSAKNKF